MQVDNQSHIVNKQTSVHIEQQEQKPAGVPQKPTAEGRAVFSLSKISGSHTGALMGQKYPDFASNLCREENMISLSDTPANAK